MRKLTKINLLIFSFIILFCSFSTTVLAESENMNFTISVVQPKNQYNDKVTYLDLMVKPSEKQPLEVNVTNTGKDVKKIKVTPTNAITSTSGIVDYSIQKKDYKYDETLKTPFTSLVSKEQTVEVKAGETKKLTFDFQAPDEPFDGVILGSFAANLMDEEKIKEQKKEGNVMFINKFQLVKGVVLRSSEKKVEPVLKLNEVKPALYAYRTAVTANIQNTTPVLLKKVNIDTKVYEQGKSDVIKSEKRDDIELAPNSNYDFPIMWNDQPLEAGKYTLKMTVTADKKDFDFKKDFEITKNDSYNLNKKAVDLEEQPKKNYTFLFISLIFGVIILALIFVIVREKTKNKRRSHKKKNSKKQTSSKSKKTSSKNKSKPSKKSNKK